MEHLFDFVPNYMYETAYIGLMVTLSMIVVLRYIGSGTNSILMAKPTFPAIPVLLSVVLILFLGLRPTGAMFGDSYFYRHIFNSVAKENVAIQGGSEWLWDNIIHFFQVGGLTANDFFLFIEIFYIGSMTVACIKLFPNNPWISLLFCLVSYSTYSYGVNGIRNGMAASMTMLGLSFIVSGKKRDMYVALFIFFLVLGIHRSMALPMLAVLAAIYYVKDTKQALYFWLASIVISLLLGNYIGSIFAGLGFDDRMSEYFTAQNNEADMQYFSQTGFRFDFLLYSSMPVLFTWYCTVKRDFQDRTFNLLAITYILSNSFWIMVIRAAYSNRFAYLSWFLYPIVIVYPLLRFRLWDDQDRFTAVILFLYAGFTLGMFMLGK